MLAPLALAALLAAPSAAFMPAGIPSLRGKSPMLSAQRAKVANRPSFGLRTRQGHGSLLYMLSERGSTGSRSGRCKSSGRCAGGSGIITAEQPG